MAGAEGFSRVPAGFPAVAPGTPQSPGPGRGAAPVAGGRGDLRGGLVVWAPAGPFDPVSGGRCGVSGRRQYSGDGGGGRPDRGAGEAAGGRGFLCGPMAFPGVQLGDIR